MEQTILNIIMYSGDARGFAWEAVQHAKKGEFDRAKELLEEASEKIASAQVEQMALIHRETEGEKIELSLLMMHAHDHIMTAIVFKDLATEFVEVYGRL